MPVNQELLPIEELRASPDLYPERIRPKMRLVEFCEMSLDSYRDTAFLDHRISKAGEKTRFLALNQIQSPEQLGEPSDARYIFHNAFCCSTLLTRYLDAVGVSLTLREPNSLYELATYLRFRGRDIVPNVSPQDWDLLHRLLNFTLGRRYSPNTPTIIKPSDGCNNLMEELLSYHENNRAVFIYSTLERFLASVLKLEQRHEWAKVRVRELALDRLSRYGRIEIDPTHLNQWQAAALTWIYHMDALRSLHQSPVGDRVLLLNSEDLLKDTVASLHKIFIHFEMPVNEATIEQSLSAARLVAHSKDPGQQYNQELREKDFQITNKELKAEIDAGIDWARTFIQTTGIEQPLVGI